MLVLPVGAKDRVFRKWLTKHQGPFRVHHILGSNVYYLVSLKGETHHNYINGRYLKKYFPTLWEKIQLKQFESSSLPINWEWQAIGHN